MLRVRAAEANPLFRMDERIKTPDAPNGEKGPENLFVRAHLNCAAITIAPDGRVNATEQTGIALGERR